MARTAQCVLDGVEYTLQSVTPSWYFAQSDEYNVGRSGADIKGYTDAMLRNVVVSPAEVRNGGLSYFDQKDDISTPLALLKEIEAFLHRRGRYAKGAEASAAE